MALSVARRTPLFTEHLRAGARMIPFGGWEMPVFYTSILAEHQAVRQAAGMFDISHMGQLEVTGPESLAFLNEMLTNNLSKLEVGEGQYSLLLNEQAGVIDDLIVYRRAETEFLLVVNAAKIEEDFGWLAHHQTGSEVQVTNRSDDFAAVAVQGPASAQLFASFGELPMRNHLKLFVYDDSPILVARTGYTGEDGFEAFFPTAIAPKIWQYFLELGSAVGMLPCGLGSRDTLRLEACYPLNGNDLSLERTPLEAGLGFFVDLNKPKFTGKEILVRQKTAGVTERLSALRLEPAAAPPRAHYPVLVDGETVGELTSGTQSPTLGVGIGLGYLPVELARIGTRVEVSIRGRRFPATVEKKPLYKRAC